MNNLASKQYLPVASLANIHGADDEEKGDLHSEAVRAARNFVSHSAKRSESVRHSPFVDSVIVPGLVRQLSVLGHVVSHYQKSELELTENFNSVLDSLISVQDVEVLSSHKGHRYSVKSHTVDWLNSNMWFAPSRIVSGQAFHELGKRRRAKKIKDRPELAVLEPKPSSTTRQTVEIRPLGFEDLAQFKQASFGELDTRFATQAFVASDKLLRIWAEGLNALRIEADADLVVIPSDRTDRSLHKELEREVDNVISNYARYMSNRYGGQSFKLTFGGQFYAPFEAIVSESLILPPRTSVLFLDELINLLVEQAQDGAKFKRRWGELRLDATGNLLLKLEKQKVRKAADYF